MNRGGGRHVVWLMGLAGALVLAAGLVLAGLSAGQAEAQMTTERVGVDSVLAHPRLYLHRTVTLRGQVVRVWGQHAIALRSQPLRQGLLVVLVGQTVEEAGLHEGQTVEVTGSVRGVHRQELQALSQGLGVEVGGDRMLLRHHSAPYVLADRATPVDALE